MLISRPGQKEKYDVEVDLCDAWVVFYIAAKLEQGDFADNFPIDS